MDVWMDIIGYMNFKMSANERRGYSLAANENVGYKSLYLWRPSFSRLSVLTRNKCQLIFKYCNLDKLLSKISTIHLY
jgi:hypothetical protein